jgi:hypothetical protein
MRILISLIVLLMGKNCMAQWRNLNREQVDVLTYRLYLEGKWDSLVVTGKAAIQNEIDFNNLRLRIGYAYVQMNQHAKAIVQYEAVLKKDAYHETALYYGWYCWNILNQTELATSYLTRLPKDQIWSSIKNPIKLISLGYESSYKITSTTFRSNAWYQSLQFKHSLGYRWQLNHAVHSYQQRLNEPKFTGVENNANIAVNQLGIYHQSTFTINPRWQLKTMGQYFHTPFNNLSFNNWLSGISLKRIRPFVQAQASVYFGTITDTSLQQFDLTLEYQPWGDALFYGISTWSTQRRNGIKQNNLKQVLGVRITKNLWVEGNITLGRFSNRLENEGMYVYNAVDPNRQKWGITGYWNAGKNLQLKAGYLYEQRDFFLENNSFTQHALNTSLTWTF